MSKRYPPITLCMVSLMVVSAHGSSSFSPQRPDPLPRLEKQEKSSDQKITDYHNLMIEDLSKLGWKLKEAEHYRIISNSGNQKMIDQVAADMDKIFETYKSLFKPEKASSVKFLIALFKDKESMQAGMEIKGKGWIFKPLKKSAHAYYHPKSKTLVGFEHDTLEKVRTYFFHEGTHQFFNTTFPGILEENHATAPMWFIEGLAECFGATTLRDGKVAFNDLRSMVGKDHLQTLKSAVQQKKLFPIGKFIKQNQPEFHKDPLIGYAQGFGLCYFLLNYPDVPGKGEGKYKEVITRLIDAFKAGEDRDAAYAKAFSGINLDTLDKELAQYIGKLQ